MTLDELRAMGPAEADAVRTRATARLRTTGAHHVVDTVADLVPVVVEIARASEMRDVI